MAAETGVPAIKRLLIILSVLGAVVLGAIYAIVTPPTPVIKPVASQSPSRTLAYQQQSRARAMRNGAVAAFQRPFRPALTPRPRAR